VLGRVFLYVGDVFRSLQLSLKELLEAWKGAGSGSSSWWKVMWRGGSWRWGAKPSSRLQRAWSEFPSPDSSTLP